MDVASNDGLDIDEDADEPKVKSFSNAPSQQEVEDRNVNNLPFRSWCKHCVRGKSEANSRTRWIIIEFVMFQSLALITCSCSRQSDGEEKGMPSPVMKDTEPKTVKACTLTGKRCQ